MNIIKMNVITVLLQINVFILSSSSYHKPPPTSCFFWKRLHEASSAHTQKSRMGCSGSKPAATPPANKDDEEDAPPSFGQTHDEEMVRRLPVALDD